MLACSKFWAEPPLTLFDCCGVPHVYVVPGGTLVGFTSKVPSLQIVADISVSCADGERFTNISTINGAPTQEPVAGVTVYEAVAFVLLMLVNVWIIADKGLACALAPIIEFGGESTGNVHVYVVPTATFAGVILNGLPLQIVAFMGATPGVGLTVCVKVNGLPGQPNAKGVMVYVAVAKPDVVFVRVSVMFD